VRYTDFDVWIDARTQGRYGLRAVCALQGEATDESVFDPAAAELRQIEERLSREDTDAAFLKDVGTRLWSVLFEAEKHDLDAFFERVRGAFPSDGGDGLRVRLRIAPAPVAHLPWELLYSRRAAAFLATDAATALVRYVELTRPIRALETAFPIRVLAVMPHAQGLDAAGERRIVQEAIEDLRAEGHLEINWLDGEVTLQRMTDTLLEKPHHLVHFIGHGGFEDEQPYLVLNGTPARVGQEEFASLFRNHATMKLVVLNSCQGAEVSASKPLLGMAPELVKCGVPAVVAMKYPIHDEQAILFAREFYRCLFRGQDRGRVEVAISHVRNRLAASFPGDRVVAAPVLFTRAPEGVLFSLPGQGRLGHLPLGRRELRGAEAAIRTHEYNLALLEGGDEREQETRELAQMRQRVRLRNRALAAVLAVGLVMSLLASLQVFDRLPPEWKLESYTAWLGDAFRDKPFRSDSIALVATGESINFSWRPRHASVINQLADAGAKVVAMDMLFQTDHTEYEPLLVAAVRRARERGTAVVVAVGNLQDSEPNLLAGLRGVVTSWGLACLGQKWVGAMSTVPLVTDKSGSPANVRLPALSLAAVLAYRGETLWRIVDTQDPGALGGAAALDARTGQLRHVEFSDVERVVWSTSKCTIIAPGDTVGTRIIDQTSLPEIRKHLLRYEDVEAGRFDRSLVAGRIVVVGSSRESFGALSGLIHQARSGMELHADAINTVLSGVTIRPLNGGWQFVITLVMAAIGAALQYYDPGPKTRVTVLIAALVTYLAGNVWLYVSRQAVLNTLFQVGALFLTYRIVGRFSKRWCMKTTQGGYRPIFALWALLAVLPATTGCATAGFGRLEGALTGDRLATGDDLQGVRIVRAGGTARTEPGMTLLKGDRIATAPGTRAVLSFAAGWEVILEPESELEILNPTIFVRIGVAIASSYAKVREILKAQTEYVVAAPESTQYVVEVHGETFTLSVLKGRVRLESTTGSWPPSVFGPAERGQTVGAARPQRMAPLDPRQVNAILRRVEAIRGTVTPRVPRVVGLQLKDAESALRDAGFDVRVHEQITGRAPVGTVVSQRPEAETEATVGQRVTVVVEGASAEVPNLQGLPLAEARAVLAQTGMALGTVSDELRPGMRAGMVLSQGRRPGERVSPGTRVAVVISAEGVTVPDVSGRPVKDALAVLTRVGLASTAQATASSAQKAGSVTGQSPVAGTLVRRGTLVTVFYVQPPPATIEGATVRAREFKRRVCTVPKLIGLSVAKADEELKRAGLEIGEHPHDTSVAVSWQSAAVGSVASCGTRVNVGSDTIR
jgi:beta-lactam-binding protein with PASTA domain/CHASE2 domain-containing sensor protein